MSQDPQDARRTYKRGWARRYYAKPENAEKAQRRRARAQLTAKAWRLANRERVLARERAYRKENREKISAYQKEYEQKNREKRRIYNRGWRQRNPERCRDYAQRNYAQRDPEQRAAYSREYYRKNRVQLRATRRESQSQSDREQARARAKAWYKTHRDYVLARQKAYYLKDKNKGRILARNRKYREDNRERVLAGKKVSYRKNKEKIRSQQAAYRAQNKDKINANDKRYREENREQLLTRKKEYYSHNRDGILSRQSLARRRTGALPAEAHRRLQKVVARYLAALRRHLRATPSVKTWDHVLRWHEAQRHGDLGNLFQEFAPYLQYLEEDMKRSGAVRAFARDHKNLIPLVSYILQRARTARTPTSPPQLVEPPESTQQQAGKKLDRLPPKYMDLSRQLDPAVLTTRQRECLSLKFEHKLTVRQIGEYLGIHHKTVEEHLAAGDRALTRARARNQRQHPAR